MNQLEIESAIIKRVGNTDIKAWTIGITQNPPQRIAQHQANKKNTSDWTQWKADSESVAREVEKYFLDKGMQGDTGGGDKPNWVYIF